MEDAEGLSANPRVGALTVGVWTGASSQPAPNNLPRQVTPLIGRGGDLHKVTRLVRAHPLTTLVGTGGVGKTRLAIRAGEALLEESGDGVWLVELAALNDPASVVQAIASTFSLGERDAESLLDVVLRYLQSRRLVIIVDNCEHLVNEAARVIDAIVLNAPHVRILATSREPLSIAAEHIYRVPSLAVPSKNALSAEEARRYAAVALFAERAEAAHPDFELTDSIAPVVGEICKRFDGIPLAIEVAAARVLALTPHYLLHRLDEHFAVLASDTRSALPRQQTMHALIDWSYDLLSEQEQQLFRRVAIFAGGWTLDAAETVCADETADILDRLTSLVEKSLVVADVAPDSTRYRLLESTRAVALEKLTATGEREPLSRRHAEYFLQSARAIRDPELHNYRAALEWADRRYYGASLNTTPQRQLP
jgi:predicted ATPase